MDNTSIKHALNEAVENFQKGNHERARQIVAQILKQAPDSEEAWILASQLAKNEQEEIHILKKWLAIKPDHQVARERLNLLLLTDTSEANPSQTYIPGEIKTARKPPKPLNFVDILLLPVIILQKMPLYLLLIPAALIIFVGGYIYYQTNMVADFSYKDFIFTKGFEEITKDDHVWRITFEFQNNTTFSGKVRHTSPFREGTVPMITHDILVTSGEYADSTKVNTRVTNHKFFWKAVDNHQPEGTINLLHTVPKNDEIYQQLLSIKDGDIVTITGREILKIDIYTGDKYEGYWQDAGCNTTLITSVQILAPTEKAP
ncbi:MAG TPA: hypothetical protein PKW33_04685 [Anaerolineaceae bacterium]|nr:hypothetical protein [Anaerolineaceae bacterium]HPN50859.1 hypothetical protein [Anaerolineaceae bacterium]